MKPTQSNRRTKAMTLIEVVVVLAVIAIVAAMVLPAIMNRPDTSRKISCTNNLKQIGLSFWSWSGDNNDKFPMQVSITNGGAMELAALGNAAAVFQVMSNEMSNPKIALCPNGSLHSPATNWGPSFSNKTVSYFVGLDAIANDPISILSGDDNFEINGTEVKSGVLQLTTNTPIQWTKARHRLQGNILLADGSVYTIKNSELAGAMTNQYAGPVGFTNRFRLAIP